MIKAYCARDKDGDTSTVVFAESAAQAKVIAQSTDCCGDVPYIDIRVTRVPALDGLYKGRSEVDWYDDETRVILVRDYGWWCWEPSWECDSCPARQYCRWHSEEDD